MLSLRKPSAESLRRFLSEQAKLNLTYSAVGATAGNPPPGYVVDHTRFKLGEGKQVYEAAKSALRRWDQFRLGWLEAGPQDTPIQTGAVVAIVARAIGLRVQGRMERLRLDVGKTFWILLRMSQTALDVVQYLT